MNGTTADIPVDFTVVERDRRVVSFCCDVVMYTGVDLTSVPAAVIYIYEKFLAACPPDTLRWYATENMTRHKVVTPRALDMLRGWLKPGAPARPVTNIHLKDGAHLDDAGEYSFWVHGAEPGAQGHGVYANMIRCAFPGRWAVEHPDRLLAFTAEACAQFPVQSGHAGLVLETNRYAETFSETAAWRLSMQHPGLDISNPIRDSMALQRDAIKGVNWLTILGSDFAGRLGGASALRQQLPDSVVMHTLSDVIILQAGPAPRWGHVNRGDALPEYRAVYKVVAPLQESALNRYTSFSMLGADRWEKTEAWFRRFADGR